MSLFKVNKATNFIGPHQNEQMYQAGAPIDDAKVAMVMVHGRGASAPSILALAEEFDHQGKVHFRAPQASGSTWYPYSFLAPTDQNQPGLNSGLQAIYDVIASLLEEGFIREHIFILGFSQGACLATEFVARHPDKYAGVIALSGGVIGDQVNLDAYTGDLQGTPLFMGCSDIDPHIPVERLHETEALYEKLGAKVTKKIYPGMGHLVNEDEIKHINAMLNTMF